MQTQGQRLVRNAMQVYERDWGPLHILIDERTLDAWRSPELPKVPKPAHPPDRDHEGANQQ